MNKLPIILLSATLLFGCASTPTADAVGESGLRVATIAYVTRGKTPDAQAERADQVLRVVALVRAQIAVDGGIVLHVDDVAAVANQRIQASDLAPGDKQLAQALVVEAILLAGSGSVEVPDIGADNAARILALLTQIERAAAVFVATVTNA